MTEPSKAQMGDEAQAWLAGLDARKHSGSLSRILCGWGPWAMTHSTPEVDVSRNLLGSDRFGYFFRLGWDDSPKLAR